MVDTLFVTMAEESILPPVIDFPIDSEILIEVVSKAKDWALMHGAGMRSKTNFNSDVLYVSCSRTTSLKDF